MANGLLQSNTAASAAASPASISPALAAASTPGNCLILVVCVTGTAVSITTPAGWTLIQTATIAATLSVAMFVLPNNVGGITSVAVTVTATGGGAAAAIFEFTGQGPTATVESSANTTATSNSYANPGLSPLVPAANELMFYAIGLAAATVTPANSSEWSSVVGAAVSTSGTPNAQIACFWGNPYDPGIGVVLAPPTFNSVIGGSLSASVAHGQVGARFFQGAATPVIEVTNGGFRAVLQPMFNQGMIGG